MTIARLSPLPSPFSAKPALDETRRLCAERSLQGAICTMEGSKIHASSLSLSPSSSPSLSSLAGAMTAHRSAAKNPHSETPTVPSARPSCDGSTPPSPRLAFVYGTLKRGFGNHWLMEELMAGAHAHFLGYACTKGRFPLICGPFQVPFLLSSPSPSGHHVRGELYQVDSLAVSRLDELEGVGKGHYERHPIDVQLIPHTEMGLPAHQNGAEMRNGDMEEDLLGVDVSSLCSLTEPLSSCRLYMDSPNGEDETEMLPSSTELSRYLRAEAYFACADYGLRMADCAPHIPCYTEKEASTYVRRKDRPHNRTFLEHVHAWIEEQQVICT